MLPGQMLRQLKGWIGINTMLITDMGVVSFCRKITFNVPYFSSLKLIWFTDI